MVQDISQFYQRGEGLRHINNLSVLKREFVSGWDITEMQKTVKELINREIAPEVFESRMDFLLTNTTQKLNRDKAQQFFKKTFQSGQADVRATIHKQQLLALEQSVMENFKKFQACITTDAKQLKKRVNFEGIPFSRPPNQPWTELFNDHLNFLNEKTQALSERDALLYGKEIYADGSKYQGYFLNGQRHLLGTRYYSDGSTYSGEWANGQRSGRGTLFYFRSQTYTGKPRAAPKHRNTGTPERFLSLSRLQI